MAEGAFDNIVFYELSRGFEDVAEFSKYARFALNGGDHTNILNDGLANDCLPDNPTSTARPVPIDQNTGWSIMAEEGRNLYAIRLANAEKDGNGASTNAHFPRFLPPVFCLAQYCPPFAAYISQVERHMVPGYTDATWATFVVDQDEIRHSVEVKRMNLEGGGHYLNLPIYLNLFDRESNLPVWMAANHPHLHEVQAVGQQAGAQDHDHDHANGLKNHGGIHPPTKSGVKLHGGIHPPTFANSMYVNLPE